MKMSDTSFNQGMRLIMGDIWNGPSIPAARLFPISAAPKDGSVIIVVYKDASGVKSIRYGLPKHLDPEEYQPSWYESDWSFYLEDDDLESYMGWIKPPVGIAWSEGDRDNDLEQMTCAQARKDHIRLYREENEALESSTQRLIRVIGRVQQVCEEHGLGKEIGRILLEECVRDLA